MKADSMLQAEYAYRLKAILGIPWDKVPGKNDYARTMQLKLRKSFGQGGKSSDVLRGLIINEKWDEKIAKRVFSNIAPDAAFDPIRKVPIAEDFMRGIRLDPEYKVLKGQTR